MNALTVTLKNALAVVATAGMLCAGYGALSSVSVEAANGVGLCHDSFSGVTYDCPDKTKEKVDGKEAGSFSKTKCYVYSDPNKGWQSLDCNKSIFTSTTTIPRVNKTTDSATNKNACPEELRAGEGGCDLIARYANPLITFLTVAVGLVVTISIVIGGIQYATARNNPQAIGAAKTRITNALLGFLAYSLLWGFLQWMIPQGFFKN